MAEPTLAQAHPAEVWKSLLAAIGIIGTLISVLYYRLNKDISEHDKKLSEGNKAFVDIGNTLIVLGEKIANIQTTGVFTDQELDRIDLDIKDLTRRLTVLETEHNSCIPRKLALKGLTSDD